MVDVLGVGIVPDPCGSPGLVVMELSDDSVERLADGGDLRFGEDLRRMQGERVRLAGNHLLFEELPVESQRTLPLVEERVERLAEPPRPHLHLTASFLSPAILLRRRARVRAGRPSIWMKPFASF